MCGILTNNLKTMKKTYNETQKKYYQKHRLEIKNKRQRRLEREETEKKFYKIGFWLLLTVGVVNLILTQI